MLDNLYKFGNMNQNSNIFGKAPLQDEDMKQKAKEFCRFYESYYSNEEKDEQLAEMTTQPFWESMRVSKKRLQDKSLLLNIDIQNEGRFKDFKEEAYYSEDKNVVSVQRQEVKTKKIYYRDGKKIYTKKGHDICSVNVMKYKGEGDEAVCPNCGNLGKISSYIDGCDYCNSKFSVQDFEEKISAFNIEENTSMKAKNILKKTGYCLGGSLLLIILMIIISFFIAIASDMSDTNMKSGTRASIALMSGIMLFPMVLAIIAITGVVSLVVGIILYSRNKDRIVNDYIVKRVIHGFSSENFAQNLEFVLRGIHLCDSLSQVSPFLHFDQSSFPGHYEDVIECSLSKIIFNNIEDRGDYYLISLNAQLNVSYYKGHKIKENTELIHLTLSGIKGLEEKNVGAIREYVCSGCGSSVDMMNGGKCSYCGNILDYSKYGWIIEDYELAGLAKNKLKSMKLKIAIVYLVTFILSATVVGLNSSDTLYEFTHMKDYFRYSNDLYDDTKTMDEVCTGVTLQDTEKGYVDRKLILKCENPELSADEYVDYLVSNGYKLLYKNNNQIELSKKVEFTKRIKGYNHIVIKFKKNNIVHCIYEMDEDED